MAQKNFRKEDFEDGSFGRYHIEYKKGEIGEGSNLIVEKKDQSDKYEVVQAEIKRQDDSIFIVWSEPFDGRLIFED